MRLEPWMRKGKLLFINNLNFGESFVIWIIEKSCYRRIWLRLKPRQGSRRRRSDKSVEKKSVMDALYLISLQFSDFERVFLWRVRLIAANIRTSSHKTPDLWTSSFTISLKFHRVLALDAPAHDNTHIFVLLFNNRCVSRDALDNERRSKHCWSVQKFSVRMKVSCPSK